MKQSLLNHARSQGVRLLLCSLIYQLVWFVCVLSATSAFSLIIAGGALICGTLVQFILWPSFAKRGCVMAIVGGLTGLIADSTLVYFGIFSPGRVLMPSPLTPIWLLLLWAGFGVYIANGLTMMYRRPLVAALAGFFCGPLAYRGGVPFGALQIGDHFWFSILMIALAWSVLFPFLLWVAASIGETRLPEPVRRNDADVLVKRVNTTSACKPLVTMVVLLFGFLTLDVRALEGDASLFQAVREIGDQELVRHGVGRLRRWFIKGCDIALYAPSGTVAEKLFNGQPKALEFYYYVDISGEQFATAAAETLRRNISPDMYRHYEHQINTMGSFFKDVVEGDRYLLFFHPGVGTVLELNGVRQGVITDRAFADLYFRIWLGRHPIDDALYKGLTGHMR